jgi:hypothetical protein
MHWYWEQHGLSLYGSLTLLIASQYDGRADLVLCVSGTYFESRQGSFIMRSSDGFS